MSRGEEKREELRRVVEAILSTGTSLSSVIDMFADVLNKAGYSEEAELIGEVASVTRETGS